MKRAFSLHGGSEFQQVWDNAKAWSHPLVVLRARPNGLEINRFGFVVGRKIGKAVERNRTKRLLREAARRRLEGMVRGWDIILIARREAERAEFKEIDTAVGNLFVRAHLIRTP